MSIQLKTALLGFESLSKALGLDDEEIEEALKRADRVKRKLVRECDEVRDAHYYRSLVRSAYEFRAELINEALHETKKWAERRDIAEAIVAWATPPADVDETHHCWNPQMWNLETVVNAASETDPELCPYVVVGLAHYFLNRQEEGLQG